MRFTTPDRSWVKADRLVDPQRLNLYAVGRNNPLRFSDPRGMDITIGKCALGSEEECLKRLQQGLRKEDREHVRSFAGEGKDGYRKGQTYVLADKNYKDAAG